MRTILEVIKRCPKPYSTVLFIRKTRFILCDSLPLETLRFEILRYQKRMTLQISRRIRNVMFDDLQEILQRHPFSERRVANSTKLNGLNLFCG